MKKKIMSVLLCLALLFTIVPKPKAHADALTAAIVSQVSMGIASSLGFTFTTSNATGAGVQSYFDKQVSDYVNANGGSITNLFGSEICRMVAGNLVVGQNLYNGVVNFIEWLKDKFTDGVLSKGNVGGLELGETQAGSDDIPAIGYMVKFTNPVTLNEYSGYSHATYYLNGEVRYEKDVDPRYQILTGNWKIDSSNGNTFMYIEFCNSHGVTTWGANYLLAFGTGDNAINWSVPDSWTPQPMPQNKEWQGDFSDTPGFADPPQDLPDFLSRIPVGIAENDLAVTGEIVEAGTGGDLPTPSPSPSPSPEYNKGAIALIIAEILALINSLSGDTAVDTETIEQVAQEVAEQAQTVPDTITQTATQTQEAIQDATQTITETMTQTQTQTQTAIQDATQTMTDTLTQTQTQTQEAIQDATQTITDSQTEIKDAIQDQTQEITDIKDAIQDATDVPTRDKWEQVKKDLHGVFPFCIPWDIYGMLTAFSAEPRAPHFEYPFQIPSIGLDYTLELDFAEFDPVAQILRTVELIAFSIGLAILTSKVIRW